MATRFFSNEQMERLRSFPDIGKEELIRFFTLTQLIWRSSTTWGWRPGSAIGGVIVSAGALR